MSPAATDTKPTLMLLDGNSLAFRAFYALPAENFKTQGGLTTNAVYGFTAMLINLLRDEQPTHIAAAFDVSRQTFRKEKYPEYKAGRSATPDEFRGQIDITKEVLGALGITVLAEAGFRGRRHHRHAGHPGRGRGLPRPGRHRRPRLAATRQRRRHRALPAQGRQRADPVHARGRGREVRADARPVPGLRRAARRPERQPARHSRRGGEDRDEVDRRVRLAAGAGRQGRHRARARSAMRCAPTCRTSSSTASSPSWSRTCRWPRRPTRCGCSRGTATRSTGCSTTSSSGCCATGCSTRWRRPTPRSIRASTCAAAHSKPGELAAGSPSTATGKRFGMAVVGHPPGVRRRRDRAGDRGRRRRRPLPRHRRPGSRRRGRAGVLAGRPRRRRRRCTRRSSRCTTSRAAAGRCAGVTSDTALAAYLVRPGQRSFALDDLSLRYLKRELRADNPEQQQLSLLDDSDGVDDQAVQTLLLRASRR